MPFTHRRHPPRGPSGASRGFPYPTSPARLRPLQEPPLMPRFFFNTRIGDDIIPDVEGEELRDADHAFEVAKAMIEELLQDEVDHARLLAASLVVTDQRGD